MKLILTRHGETIENTRQILTGHLPGTLTKKGMEQAEKLSEKLRNEKIDAIYCSDLERARKTAEIVRKFHKESRLIELKELREVDLKEFTGKPGSAIDWKQRPASIESLEEMQARAKKALETAFRQYPVGTVVFVGHDEINRAIITCIQNRPASEIMGLPVPRHTEIRIFEINSSVS